MTELTKKFVGKFVADKKIRKVVEVEEKTFMGSKKVSVEYKGGFDPEVFPLDVLKEIASKKKYDLTELREKRVVPVIKNILILLTEAELKKEDISYAVGTKLTESINQSLKMANKVLWGKEPYDITLLDVDKIIKGKILDKGK